MPGLQDWVNRWIRVNSNNSNTKGGRSYQFPDDEELSHHRHVQIRHVDGSLSGGNVTNNPHHSSLTPASSSSPPPGPPFNVASHRAAHAHRVDSFRTADTNDSPDSSASARALDDGGGDHLGVALQVPAAVPPGGGGAVERPPPQRQQNGFGPHHHRGDYARSRGGGSSSRFRRRARPRGGGGGGGGAGLSYAASSWASSSGHRGVGGDSGNSSDMSMSRSNGTSGSGGSSRGRLSRTNSESDLLKIKFLTARPNGRATLHARQRAHDEMIMHRTYHGRLASPSSMPQPQHELLDDGRGLSQSQRVFPTHGNGYHQQPHHHILRRHRGLDDPGGGTKAFPLGGASFPATKTGVDQTGMPSSTTASQPSPHPPTSTKMMDGGLSRSPTFLPPAPRRRAPPPPPPVVAREGGSDAASAATTPPLAVRPSPDCGGCRALERTVLLLRSDLVYLRSMALANENGEAGASPTVEEGERDRVATTKDDDDDPDLERSSPASDSVGTVSSVHPATVVDGDEAAVAAVPATDGPPPAHEIEKETDGAAPGIEVGHRSTERRRRRPLGASPGFGRDEGHEDISLRGMSRRLEEATVLQKERIEELSRERLEWQHEVEQKTSKLTLLCKELNEESSIRREDVISLEKQLAETTANRNALASEVETLRSKLGGDVGRLKEENERLRSALGEGHTRILDRAEAAVRRRDEVIERLTGRLERTAETLRAEREQHRQRRQIIFPNFVTAAVSQHSSPSSPCRSPTRGATTPPRRQTIAAERDLARAREEAREAKAALGEVRAAAERRERELQEKCDAMARKLRVAQRSFSPDEFECGPSSQ